MLCIRKHFRALRLPSLHLHDCCGFVLECPWKLAPRRLPQQPGEECRHLLRGQPVARSSGGRHTQRHVEGLQHARGSLGALRDVGREGAYLDTTAVAAESAGATVTVLKLAEHMRLSASVLSYRGVEGGRDGRRAGADYAQATDAAAREVVQQRRREQPVGIRAPLRQELGVLDIRRPCVYA